MDFSNGYSSYYFFFFTVQEKNQFFLGGGDMDRASQEREKKLWLIVCLDMIRI